MKIYGSIPHETSGEVRLDVECVDDLWHLSEIVAPQDEIYARTTRKVKREIFEGKTIVLGQKTLFLKLEVKSVDYQGSEPSIRFSGMVLTDCPEIRLGQYHTIEITLHDTLKLFKKHWDFAAREILKRASDIGVNSSVAALLMDVRLANLYMLTESRIHLCASIARTGVKTNAAAVAHGKVEKANQKFYNSIFDRMCEKLNFASLDCIIIGGPENVATAFKDWLLQAAAIKNVKDIQNKSNAILLAPATGVDKSSLSELLKEPSLIKNLSGTRAYCEFSAIQTFYGMQKKEQLRTTYGIGGVALAAELSAIQDLIISDEFLKNQDPKCRKFLTDMAKNVETNGGKVVVVSHTGLAAEAIANLANVAAVLRYPVYELDGLDPQDVPEVFVK